MSRHYPPVVALGLIVGLSSATSAAELTPAPVYTKAPVAPPWSWTGFYVGGEVGAKLADTTWTTTSLSDFFTQPIDASSPRKFDPLGARAGGYFGYNWQFAQRWVTGVEFDAAWADQTETTPGLPGCALPVASSCAPAGAHASPGPGVDSSSVDMGWDASARVRLGYLVIPQVLLYGTGGVAWQQLEVSGTCQHSSTDPDCDHVLGNTLVTLTNSTVRTGWTVGGGVEANITGNWLVRGEYRYADFGSWNNVMNFTVAGEPPGEDTARFHLKAITQIATVGLAYKFDFAR
jgi:outer membrane immunogenic protein